MRIRPGRSTIRAGVACRCHRSVATAVAGVARSEAQVSSPPRQLEELRTSSARSSKGGQILGPERAPGDGDPFSFSYRWQRCDPTGGSRPVRTSAGASAAYLPAAGWGMLAASCVSKWLQRTRMARPRSPLRGPSDRSWRRARRPIPRRPAIGGPRPPKIRRDADRSAWSLGRRCEFRLAVASLRARGRKLRAKSTGRPPGPTLPVAAERWLDPPPHRHGDERAPSREEAHALCRRRRDASWPPARLRTSPGP